MVDLGTKDDPEGPMMSFTIASPTEEKFIMISTRIRDTLFKKKLARLGSYSQTEDSELKDHILAEKIA